MKITFPLSITGTVLHGNSIGNKIGMPTANISLPEEYSSIKRGVYFSTVTAGEKTYKGITNVGSKPTVNTDGRLNVETFIYDFDGDLYGKTIVVTLLEFRRPERKFSSVDELSVQLKEDFAAGRDYCKLN